MWEAYGEKYIINLSGRITESRNVRKRGVNSAEGRSDREEIWGCTADARRNRVTAVRGSY